MIRHLLNASIDVYRATLVDDGRGGQTRTMPGVPTLTVRARLAQPSSAERAVAAQLGAVLEYVVHVEHRADVRRGDELDLGGYGYAIYGEDGYGGRRLRVQSVVADSSSTYKRLECQVVQGG